MWKIAKALQVGKERYFDSKDREIDNPIHSLGNFI